MTWQDDFKDYARGAEIAAGNVVYTIGKIKEIQYQDVKYAACPKCGETYFVTYEPVIFDEGTIASEDACCDECGVGWTNLYDMKYRSSIIYHSERSGSN